MSLTLYLDDKTVPVERIGSDIDGWKYGYIEDMCIWMHQEKGLVINPKEFVTHHLSSATRISAGQEEEWVREFEHSTYFQASPPDPLVKRALEILSQNAVIHAITGRADWAMTKTQEYIDMHFAGIIQGVHYVHHNHGNHKKSTPVRELSIDVMIEDSWFYATEIVENTGIPVILRAQPWNRKEREDYQQSHEGKNHPLIPVVYTPLFGTLERPGLLDILHA